MKIYNTSTSTILTHDGFILALIEEERLSRKKDNIYYGLGKLWCLDKVKILGEDILDEPDDVEKCYSENPLARNHHWHHAVSAYLQSGLQDASILVIDGSDYEKQYSIGIFYAKDEKVSLVRLYDSEFSLGILYDIGTAACGLCHNILPTGKGSAGKLMGLATYSNENHKSSTHNFLTVDEYTGEVTSNSYGLSGIEPIIKSRFGFNTYNYSLPCVDFSLAELAGFIQSNFEIAVFSLLTFMQKTLPSKNLIISGGCGLNCTTNGKIIQSNKWENFYIPPLCDDAGTVIGIAHAFSPLRKINTLVYNNIKPIIHDNIQKRRIHLCEIADWIKKGEPVAWFEGGSEYGPRALGHRSILANPRYKWMQYKLNSIKNREYWRPFAPVVLDSFFEELLGISPNKSSLYERMLATEKVKPKYMNEFPGILSPDGTTRPQVIRANGPNAQLYSLMSNYSFPVLINTSLNTKGEPICETLEEACRFCNASNINLILVTDEGVTYQIDTNGFGV